jgi:hypothetical protein
MQSSSHSGDLRARNQTRQANFLRYFCLCCAMTTGKRIATIRRGDGCRARIWPDHQRRYCWTAAAAGSCGSPRCGLCRMDRVTTVEARRNFTRARNCRQDPGRSGAVGVRSDPGERGGRHSSRDSGHHPRRRCVGPRCSRVERLLASAPRRFPGYFEAVEREPAVAVGYASRLDVLESIAISAPR